MVYGIKKIFVETLFEFSHDTKMDVILPTRWVTPDFIK